MYVKLIFNRATYQVIEKGDSVIKHLIMYSRVPGHNLVVYISFLRKAITVTLCPFLPPNSNTGVGNTLVTL